VVEVLDGEAEAQDVRARLFLNTCPLGGGTYDVLYAPYGEAFVARFSGGTGEEEIGWLFVTVVGDEVTANSVVIGQRSLFSALGIANDQDEAVLWGVSGGKQLAQLAGGKQFAKLL
jgi:hypothetical protein